MADKNLEPRKGGARLKAGVLPGVREIRRPDFTKKAADIEKAEAERVLRQGEDTDAADEAAVKASLEAQESAASEEEKLDESAISDQALWYVAHTYSGYENKVRTSILKTIENRNLQDQIFEVRVPVETVIENKNGVRKEVSKKLFPGYVLVNMVMNDDTWYVVPFGIATKNVTVDFEVGDMVKVVAGTWKDTVGRVQKIDFNKQCVTLIVELFGSDVSLTHGFAEVRKVI